MGCGEPLGEQESPEHFRKTVTMLFSDVVSSTALGEQLDPETLSEIMRAYFESMKVVVERHEGTVAKFIGDAVMAVFGIPGAPRGRCAPRACVPLQRCGMRSST